MNDSTPDLCPPPASSRRPRQDDPEARLLIDRYREVVHRIAGQIHRKAPPNIQRDDLIAAGMSGLWDALRRRTERPDESFDFYVCTRVRGAIIDELRAEDWLPRRRARDEQGRAVSLGHVVHFEDLGPRERESSGDLASCAGEEALDRKLALEKVIDALTALPARERYVLVERDLKGVPIKALGEELGVSKPRVCQLRTQALRRLRDFVDAA